MEHFILKTKVLIMIFVSFGVTSAIQAQVTMGSEIPPNKGALLDLKTQEPLNLNIEEKNITASKGLGLSRVWLTHVNELYPMYVSGAIPADYATQKEKQKGLTVYNINPSFNQGKGIYIWDKEKWIYTQGSNFKLTDKTTTSGPLMIPTVRQADMYLPNSYFVAPQAGSYTFSFPVKKAYAVWEYYEVPGATHPFPKSGIPSGLCTAELLWQDKQNLIESVSISSSTNDPDALISVGLTGASLQGNAVITFKVDGTVYWSWHLWVTDYNPDVITINPDVYDEFTASGANGSVYQYNNYTVGGDYIFLDRNVGAIGSTPADYPDVQGMVYQWGRKDPFPPYDKDFYDIANNKINQVKDNAASIGTLNVLNVMTYGAANNLANSINNPFTYYYYKKTTSESYGVWYTNLPESNYKTLKGDLNFSLWSENRKKTPFDPCPAGWKVPYKNNYVFPFWYQPAVTNITTYSHAYRPESFGLTYADFDNGWKFYNANYKLGYFPIVKSRSYNGSQSSNGGIMYWDSTLDPDSGDWPYFYMTSNTIQMDERILTNQANGFPVRCMKDNE